MGAEATYLVDDGVRRAKAASILGHERIWALVDGEDRERKVKLTQLRSTKLMIDVDEKKGERWRNVMEGMAVEPDLFPPIRLIPGSGGVVIADVQLSSSMD